MGLHNLPPWRHLRMRRGCRTSVARIVTERDRVAADLAAIGFHAAPSQTNFLFFDTGRDSTEVAAALLNGRHHRKAVARGGLYDVAARDHRQACRQ